ncbi:MAG TPA: lipase family protein [Bacteroidales bacterium]|nr:lipase family protein [Bacteroidales bacterium]
MKATQKLLRIFTFSFILVSAFTSCKKESDTRNYNYFVSKELYTSYNQTYMLSMIDAASIYFPAIQDLKQYVKSGTSLYRIVYESTIRGEKKKLSGIVCVPTERGNYPVLSFQNGTNTLNYNAPSEFPADKGYQLVQVISSMGYIVVISDYPGFGESKDIPHPYLVAEPTVRSLVDMLFAVKEMDNELPDADVKNEYYVMGYSQGGWATLQLHRALELEYKNDFNLKASVCGAGPYNIMMLMEEMFDQEEFPMPYYIGYILNAYKAYNQFTNPVSDILNEPYASRIGSLYTGLLTSAQINGQLTTSMTSLINPDFRSGFKTSTKYASVREAMVRNSVTPWHTYVPLLMFHGSADTHVLPVTTENMYSAMIQAGTSENIIRKVLIPGADHAEGIIPSLVQGFVFINNIKNSGK